ncbi:MAG TPA: OmpA family protein [Novosphingobium sp.]|nr:OmpA family protein [Novosphingobium sp.]
MKNSRPIPILTGALATVLLGTASQLAHGPALVGRLDIAAATALLEAGGNGASARFLTSEGWLTRHPTLAGGDTLDDAIRARAALAVSRIPGMGGVHWALSQRRRAATDSDAAPALHCQQDVEAVVKARSIRFAEGSAAFDPASEEVLGEVAAALGPCVGSIIAINGHTDAAGDEAGNVELSFERAEAVRRALVGRGIPADGLRARGVGSAKPLAGLEKTDTANRRIEFSVIATVPLAPTPVDTPGAG